MDNLTIETDKVRDSSRVGETDKPGAFSKSQSLAPLMGASVVLDATPNGAVVKDDLLEYV